MYLGTLLDKVYVNYYSNSIKNQLLELPGYAPAIYAPSISDIRMPLK